MVRQLILQILNLAVYLAILRDDFKGLFIDLILLEGSCVSHLDLVDTADNM
jgi:hypothetical protein